MSQDQRYSCSSPNELWVGWRPSEVAVYPNSHHSATFPQNGLDPSKLVLGSLKESYSMHDHRMVRHSC